MNYGEWMSVLEYLEDKNDSGRSEICRCSQCDGTYIHDRAYFNEDGDIVLSKDTLTSLLDDFKYSNEFDTGKYNCETKELENAGRFYYKYWNSMVNTNNKNNIDEESRLNHSLRKKKYQNDHS